MNLGGKSSKQLKKLACWITGESKSSWIITVLRAIGSWLRRLLPRTTQRGTAPLKKMLGHASDRATSRMIWFADVYAVAIGFLTAAPVVILMRVLMSNKE